MTVKATRRKFFGLMGSAPIAAKAAADQAVAGLSGLSHYSGLGDTGIHIPYGGPPNSLGELPWEQRIIKSVGHIKLFGMPDFVEFRLREQAKNISSLDPDLAIKRSWSMNVKITEQRQRYFNRLVAEIEMAGPAYMARSKLKTLLGFEWPW